MEINRIRVIKDFPDDDIQKGELGIIVGKHQDVGTWYAVILDEDDNVPPVYLLEEDFERIE